MKSIENVKKKQGKKKNQYLVLGIFLVIIILVLTITGNYYRGNSGFVIYGNRINISTRVEANTLFIDIEKTIVRSNAYKGMVEIKVMPKVPKGIDLEHGYLVSEFDYEFNFTNAKKEQFTVQCPYARINYLVQFKVGTEEATRTIFHASF